MSTEIVPIATEHEARRGTERIRLAEDRVATAWAELVERVTEGYEKRYDVALGYDSWEEYAKTELSVAAAIPTQIRRDITKQLSQVERWQSRAPMSTRAIAAVVGVDQKTVSRDQVRHYASPETPSQADVRQEAVNNLAESGLTQTEIAEEIGVSQPTVQRDLQAIAAAPPKPAAPEHITGLDGKTYPARRPTPEPEHHYRTEGLHGYVPPEIPEPSKPHTDRRKPWNDMADAAIIQLDSAVKAIEALAKDDRFPKYKGDATKTVRYIALDRDALQRVIDQFN